jgi:hypothetical protein
MNAHPAPNDLCSECGAEIEPHYGDVRCPACFEKQLYEVDVGFLESYRRFGSRSRLIVAESCLRSLVVESPDHRKVLAMTIFEQYVQAMNDLVGLFAAFRLRHEAPILKTFLEFKLNPQNSVEFYETVRNLGDPQLCALLDLPMPGMVQLQCQHLSREDAYSVSVAIHHLMQDLRKATDQGEAGALALAQMAGQVGGSIIASDAKWLEDASSHGLTPDQVALLVLDTRRRNLYVQGLTADEGAMGRVVDAVDTATRAASNLIFAYLQTQDL